MIDSLLKITIALIMVGIGSSISIREIREIFKKPKKIIWGLFAQMILFPAIAISIAIISNIPVEYKIGLVILSACPGGTLSNFISYIIKADTPLAASLTSTNALITLITIPLYVKLAFFIFSNDSISIILPLGKLILDIFLITIIPLVIGLIINNYYKKVSLYETPLKITSSILLATVFILKFIYSAQNSSFLSNFHSLLIWAVLLNILGILMGYLIGYINKFPQKTSITFGIEVGLQNTVLALLVTDVILKMPALGEPALIYAMFSFWITLLFSIFLKRKKSWLNEIGE